MEQPSRFLRLSLTLATIAALAVGLSSSYSVGVASTQAAPPAQGDSHYFPETKHTVAGKFWQYWQGHGGLQQQGYPISEQLQEKSEIDGKTYTAQYFERAVFELHPEKAAPYDVLLSLLGTLLYNQKYTSGAPGQSVDAAAGAQKFPETGKTVGGMFLDYWKSHGGLAQQGFPISEEFTETSPLDGKPYKVQYFERAVFEAHPEQKAPYNVLLSQLGTFRYQAHYGAQTGGGAKGDAGPAAFFSQGVDAYKAGNYDDAITAFGQAIQASAQYEAAYVNRAIAYFAKGDNANALKDLNQATGIQPKDTTPLYLSGIVLYKQGDFAGAVQAFSNLAQANASDVRGYYWRAYAYLGQNDTANAQDDFGRAARLAPDANLGKQAQAALDQLTNGETPAAAQIPALDPVQGDPPAPTPTPTQPAGGQLVSDLTFRPQTDGFKFENYVSSPTLTDLTPADLRRMFGDQVCANLMNGCTLTPPAQQWMDKTNKDMAGGHCEGFASLSLVFFQHKEDPNQFGAPKTHDLTLDGNTNLQREIAYFWATQATNPTSDAAIMNKTPAEILDILIDAFKTGSTSPKTYTMGIFQPGFKDGHAITPYAVEDRGNGQYAVRVYDNNFPDLERELLINRTANTWTYEGSTDPSQPNSTYRGDATTKTLGLTPTDPRLQTQVCDFCTGGNPGGTTTNTNIGGLGDLSNFGILSNLSGFQALSSLSHLSSFGSFGSFSVAQATTRYNEVSLDGNAHLLITDAQGRRTGYVTDTQFVNEIPGLIVKPITSANLWQEDLEPVYDVPTGVQFSLAVENPDPKNDSLSTVSMIGPGYDLSVEDLVLEPNTADHINFSPDGKTIVYKTDYSDSPDMVLGTDGTNADYSFDLKGVDLADQGSVTTHLDTDKGRLVLDAKDNTEATTYSLTMDRIDDQSEQVFGHDNIQLQPGDTAYLDYAAWQGNGTPLLLEIDHGSDGTIDTTLELSDVH